ncbi:MAG TPA: hypothetical protein VGD66_12950 [Allosphingosinicella sp.]
MVTDERPAMEKKNRLWSPWIWDCDFGVYNIGDGGIGDERLAQDRLGDLRRHLEAQLGARLAGKTLRISAYRIIVNGNARAKAFSVGGSLGGGAVGEALAGAVASGKTHKAKCPPAKMTLGWFDMSEISNTNSPIVVEIVASLDGRPVRGRAVRSPSRELYKGVTLVRLYPPDLEDFRQTISAASEDLAASIALALPPS